VPAADRGMRADEEKSKQGVVLAHAVIDSRGGIWAKSAVRRRAHLTINQDNETNASISNSRYRSNISVRISRITETVRPKRLKKINCVSRE
jgi:hypothetical protein